VKWHAARHAMLKNPIVPHPLLDYCTELQAYIAPIQLMIAIYTLKGKVPETQMTGSKSDISELCKFESYIGTILMSSKQHWSNNVQEHIER
jgi:hypothetical protein